MKKSGLFVLPLLVVLAGCSVPPTPEPTIAPESTETPQAASWVGCDELAEIVDAAGILQGQIAGQLATPIPSTAPITRLHPGHETVTEAGGLSCVSSAAPWVSVDALAGAGDSFSEALAAVELAEEATPGESTSFVYSELGDGGVATCRDAGGIGLCTWSLVVADVWVVVEIFPFDLGLLVQPPDLPSGYGQQAFPVVGGELETLVGALLDAVTTSIPAPDVPIDPVTACADLVTSDRLAVALGSAAVEQRIDVEAPVDAAARVISTAGYALPFYAAERAGWSRCSGYSLTGAGRLTVVVRPLPATLATDLDEAACGPHGDGWDESCLASRASAAELRIAHYEGVAGVTDGDALRTLLD